MVTEKIIKSNDGIELWSVVKFCVALNKSLIETGPSCSKLTMSLVNDSLKVTSSDMQIC